MATLTAYNAKDCTILVDGVYITGVGEVWIPAAFLRYIAVATSSSSPP